MPVAHTGAGDPDRTLELLWRRSRAVPSVSPAAPGSRRGPRRRLSIDEVLASAIALADVEGLEALTMRRVANALGVAPMTLYTYLPGKAELLDLMLDAAYADMPLADTSHRPWRQRLAAVAEENHALYARHPWAADISTARPPLGPGLIAKYEHELAAFDGLDLQDVTVDATLTHLLGFVLSCARVANEVATMRPAGAAGDERWWAANAPLLARVLDPASYPRAVRVGTAAGRAHGAAYRPAHAYEFGLARVLDGIGALIVVSAGQELQPGRTRPVS